MTHIQLELFPEQQDDLFSMGCFNDKRLEKRGFSYLKI